MAQRTSTRHIAYSEEIGHEICTRLAEGASLISICADPRMPSVSTVYRWLSRLNPSYNEIFAEEYVHARIWQRETLVEMLEDIAKNPELTGEMRRAQMDAIKARISHLEPKKYGVVGDKKLVIRVIYDNLLATEEGKSME